ncbi:glycosyltransferase [uncultured Sulfitobacter sp.]|uniref:glycosyltransferase n=1 Tax=uncultured Sulfitobacter sp. TaxID=191468 RepID=UPI00261A83E6|nr:glycosyltransferase [uncultured Sulfitobacter sp.]
MKIAVICDFPFWDAKVGTAVRMESLCRSLAKICDLTIIASVTMDPKFRAAAATLPYEIIDRSTLQKHHEETPHIQISGVRPDRQVTVKGVKHLVEAGGFDAVLTPYFNRDWMVRHINQSVLRIVDTHDCQSQRTRSFAAHGLVPTFPMTPQEEGAELDRYDIALALSDADQAEFAAITDTPVVTAPFRLPPKPIYSVRDMAGEVMFIAAKSDVNDMTLAYLLEQVLPLVPRTLTLHVVGNVTVPETCPANVKLVRHLDVEDLAWIYRAVDLALNPTYAGGGIKTKTLEAIAYGVPVITSDEGARGLETLLPDDLVCNDKESFAHRIATLLDDPERRMALSRHMLDALRNEDSDSWLPVFAHLLRAAHARKHAVRAA